MIANADAARIPLPDKSVHAVITSPPYFGPRKYKGKKQLRDWPAVSYSPMPGLPPLDVPAMRCELGREKTPEAYTAHLVLCFREIWRVLRDDGTCWVVEGDSYSTTPPGNKSPMGKSGLHGVHTSESYRERMIETQQKQQEGTIRQSHLAQGNLLAIPYRLLLALQADTVEDTLAGGEISKAWLAGIVDGEGSIGIAKKGEEKEGWNPYFSPYLTIGMTDREVLEHVVEVTGMGNITVKAEPGESDDRGIVNRRRYFSWRLDASKAMWVIKMIYPYLIAKKKQALLAYNCDLLNGTTHTREGRVVPRELMDKRWFLFHACKQLNQREQVDMPNWIVDIPGEFRKSLWLVRNDVVWSKVAPMPESVSGTHWERHRVKVKSGQVCTQPARTSSGSTHKQRDAAGGVFHGGAEWSDCPGCPRCSATGGYVLRRGSWRHTRSHETVLMLTKGMQYFSDQERVRERAIEAGDDRKARARTNHKTMPDDLQNGIRPGESNYDLTSRNPRDVLTPAPSPFKGEHYAAFPPDLIRPLILSSAPLKCCPACGAGWAAVVERKVSGDRHVSPKDGEQWLAQGHETSFDPTSRLHNQYFDYQSNVIGYRPTCTCAAADWQPGLVLDPFCGSGTVGLVCRELGLRFVGLDISGDYLRDIALVRSERLTPDSAMVNLPLFELLHP